MHIYSKNILTIKTFCICIYIYNTKSLYIIFFSILIIHNIDAQKGNESIHRVVYNIILTDLSLQ